MPVSAASVAPIILKEVNKIITYDYAHGALDLQPQLVMITRKRLVASFTHAYVYSYEKSPEKWPDPSIVEKQGGFRAAGNAAFDWLLEVCKAGRFNTTYKSHNIQKIIFTQKRSTNKNLYTGAKTAGFRALSPYIEELRGRGITFYEDLKREGLDTKGAEDMQMRARIHREHIGGTVTGAAVIAGQIQAIDNLVPGFAKAFEGIASQSPGDMFNQIGTFFELNPIEGLTQIRLLRGVEGVNIKLGSYKFNPVGARKQDLKNILPKFQKLAEQALNKVFDTLTDKELEAFTSSDELAQWIANRTMATLTSNVAGASYRGRAARNVPGKKITGTPFGTTTPKETGSVPPTKPLTPTERVTQQQTNELREIDRTKAIRLKNLLNTHLASIIASKMRDPKLVYRTGRFAHTVNILDVRVHRTTGAPLIDYGYMEEPYSLFQDPGFRAYTRERRPEPLIEESIRELVKKEMRTTGLFRGTREALHKGEAVPTIEKRDWKAVPRGGK